MIAKNLRFHRWMDRTVRTAVVNRLRQIDQFHAPILVDSRRTNATMPHCAVSRWEELAMFSKILAVALTAVVLTVGGYAYWQYADGKHCCSPQTAPSDPVNNGPCCQEPSRTSAEFRCCSDMETPCTPEVL